MTLPDPAGPLVVQKVRTKTQWRGHIPALCNSLLEDVMASSTVEVLMKNSLFS